MDVAFHTRELRELAHDRKAATKTLGARCAEILRKRLDDLRAATSLEAMRHLPGRCHELKGDRAGELAIDLEHPKRLVFKPADGKRGLNSLLDWSSVTAIEILEIIDYH